MDLPKDLPNLQIVRDAPKQEEQEEQGLPYRIGECRRFPPTFHPSTGPVFPITSDKDRFGQACGCGQFVKSDRGKAGLGSYCENCKFWHEITIPEEIQQVMGDYADEEEEEDEEAPAAEVETAPATETETPPPPPQAESSNGG